MTTRCKTTFMVTTAMAIWLTPSAAWAQAAPATAARDLEVAGRGGVTAAGSGEDIVVVGSRVPGRTAAESASPVDVFSAESLGNNAFTQIGEALQTVAPSFNFSRTQVSDGSDLFRPATLRGLQPDQTLVLVNGKRRHTQSYLGNQDDVGGGSAGTDLNSIPLFALARVEVLRDGAAAQYGSDAIAGVIDLQLKKTVGETTGFAQWGQTYKGDGQTLTLAANTGVAIGQGFINVSGEFRDGDHTDRSDPGRIQADGQPARWRIGDADTRFYSVFVNSALPVGVDGELYAFGGYSRREAVGTGFYRDFDNAQRNVPQVYPNGFLPRIGNVARDLSVAGGYRHQFGEWRSDVSAVYGKNLYSFDSRNTINASIAADYLARNPTASNAAIAANAGPREGYSGGLAFDQLTFNADVSGKVQIGSMQPLNVAFGAEFRREGFEIEPGSLASYSCGIDDNPTRGVASVIDRVTPAACGFQAFPGFRPATATDIGRSSYALYADVEVPLADTLKIGVAGRYEHFENVGGKVAGKINARWDPTDVLGLRGSISNGFRAPSLQQSGYTGLSTNVGASGALEQSLTARAGSAFPVSLGIDRLRFETSRNYGAGLVLRPTAGMVVTVDGYLVKIKDRIAQSSGINAATLTGLSGPLAAFNALNVQQVYLFSNAIDTTTRGLDVVTTYRVPVPAGNLNLSVSANLNRTTVDRINPPAGIASSVIFGSTAASILTGGQPKARGTVAANYGLGRFSSSLRLNYFGATEVDVFAGNQIPIPGTRPTSRVGPAALADLELSYALTDGLNLSVGGNNIFDKTPHRLASNEVLEIITGGAARYPLRAVPYGFNGGQYYARIGLKF